MAFGDTGEHGQAAARPVLAAKRFVIENVIVQLEIMVEKHVLVLIKTLLLAISSLAQVKNRYPFINSTTPFQTLRNYLNIS